MLEALPALTQFQFEGPTLSSASLPCGGCRPPELTALLLIPARTSRLFGLGSIPSRDHTSIPPAGQAAGLPEGLQGCGEGLLIPICLGKVQLPVPSSLALSCCGHTG